MLTSYLWLIDLHGTLVGKIHLHIEPCMNYTAQIFIIHEVPKLTESFLVYQEDEENHDMMAINFEVLIQLLVLHAT